MRDGSIRLLARDNTLSALTAQAGANRTGTLTVGQASRTEITLDSSDAATVDVNAQPRSSIELTGQTIAIQANAVLRATGGTISARASSDLDDAGRDYGTAPDSSRIFIDKGAVLDVSRRRAAAARVA